MSSGPMTNILIIVVVLAVILVALRLTPLWDKILSSGAFTPTDFGSLKPKRRPNWYLVCPKDHCGEVKIHMEAPSFDFSKEELAEKLKSMIKSEGNVTVRHEDEHSFDVVIRTPLVRWPDLVSIEFLSTGDGQSTVAIYSRSIYGRSDLGANKARVGRWLRQLGPGA